jgi:hypothetical protein
MSDPLIEKSPLFVSWKDPVSGVESFLLDRRAAPLQQSFYFTIDSFACGGRYLWFYGAFPPGADAYYGRQLAVADLEEGEVRLYPETQFTDASPGVDLETGEAYWTTALGLYKRGPRPEDAVVQVNTFPAELARNRRPLRIATHLTRSADGKSFAIDATLGRDWFLGDMPVNGEPFRLWQKLDRGYNHAQFSPVDPDLILVAQDGWHDCATGEKCEAEDRIWLIRRGGEAYSLFPDSPSNVRGHEWWGADGRHVWYIHYGQGVARVPTEGGEAEIVWPFEKVSHAHVDAAEKYIVGDAVPHDLSESRVAFLNRETDQAVDIVSHLPYPEPVMSSWKSKYHVHPHPRFCLEDRYIVYTTTVRGVVDVAVTPVASLIERTGG